MPSAGFARRQVWTFGESGLELRFNPHRARLATRVLSTTVRPAETACHTEWRADCERCKVRAGMLGRVVTAAACRHSRGLLWLRARDEGLPVCAAALTAAGPAVAFGKGASRACVTADLRIAAAGTGL